MRDKLKPHTRQVIARFKAGGTTAAIASLFGVVPTTVAHFLQEVLGEDEYHQIMDKYGRVWRTHPEETRHKVVIKRKVWIYLCPNCGCGYLEKPDRCKKCCPTSYEFEKLEKVAI